MNIIKNTLSNIIALVVMLILSPSIFANGDIATIKVINQLSEKTVAGKLNTTFDIVISDEFKLRSNDMIMFTPILRSNTTNDSLVLNAMVVSGSKRNMAQRRSQSIYNISLIPQDAYSVSKRDNHKVQVIHYENEVDYAGWMRNSRIEVENIIYGCAKCESEIVFYTVSDRILPDISYDPTYKVSFIAPEAEAVKARSDVYSASLSYRVGSAELVSSFKDNAQKLAEVDEIIRKLRGDSNIDIKDIRIVGYASPEGNFKFNKDISEKRAQSFANYLERQDRVNGRTLCVASVGEDWEGLRRAIELSTMNDRDEILKIIDTVEDADARDALLNKLSNGITYNTLLADYYPALRRSEYTIAYVARAFDVEEAKGIIETNPKYLSLNEMFLVANTYETGSDEFKRVFEIALRQFPDSDVAMINASVAAIEAGDNEGAIEIIEKSEHKDKALNILGVANARMGKLDVAMKLFDEAASAGDLEAKHNKDELQKHVEGLEE